MIRRWHHWETWECVPAGMYLTIAPKGYTSDSAIEAYSVFLRDLPRFERSIRRVLLEWPISCEQFLSNPNINRIAWIGQSSMCIDTGVPAAFKAGFSKMTERQQDAANEMADKWLRNWEACH